MKPEQLDSATAQLMLIESKGPGQFSQIYNEDEAYYNQGIETAKLKNCDISKYPPSPINEFKLQMEKLKAGGNQT